MGQKSLAERFRQWAAVKLIEIVNLSELSTASALKSLHQMGLIFFHYSISGGKKKYKKKRKIGGKKREGGKDSQMFSKQINMVRISSLNDKYRFHTLL